MGAIGINYQKINKDRKLEDFFEASQDQDSQEITEAELSQWEEMQDIEYIS